MSIVLVSLSYNIAHPYLMRDCIACIFLHHESQHLDHHDSNTTYNEPRFAMGVRYTVI